MLHLLRSRGVELFVGILLIAGEADIISITLNKAQGFFTLNVGSDWFIWQEALVADVPVTSEPPAGEPSVGQDGGGPAPAGEAPEQQEV